ncbi:hypothetical protein CHS0354_027402 [Potamilus streckersoni]|uniref:ABC transporter n=1 Tax=Potamilus streckersoni TaxID=2493646 RepID=A0AAE0W0M9_9BIVA|nr:hypothetical protein CHS0354_027402 [Potamilus streckersoni]
MVTKNIHPPTGSASAETGKKESAPGLRPLPEVDYKTLTRFVLGYVKYNKLNAAIGVMTLPVSMATTLAVPWLTVLLIDDYLKHSAYDDYLFLLGLFAGAKTGNNIICRMRADLYQKCLQLPRSYFDRHPVGTLLTRLTSDFETFGESIAVGALSIIADILKTFILICILFYINFELALVFLIILPAAFPVIRYISKILQQSYLRGRAALAAAAAYLQECLSGIKTIRVYGAEQEAAEVFEQKNRAFLNAQKKANVYESFMYSFVDGYTSLCVGVIIGYAAFDQKLALVGATGSGKSTIIRLISCQYRDYEGSIRLNGRELKDIHIAEIPRLMSVLHQDFYMFRESLNFNIGLNRVSISPQDITRAAEYVHADAFIRNLPGGYDFIIQDYGNLSAGQMQLLAFARAVVSGSELFILDEATGKIDSLTERLIEQAIEQIFREKTIIAIAHRLSTIQKSDVILVMDNGQIAERGNHQSLSALDGKYSALLNSIRES